MHAEIHKEGTTLILRAVYPRLDGGNHLLNALKSGPWLEGDVEAVEIDFGDVEYLNSLGITELVTIHRLVQEQTRGKTRFRFFNVDRKIRTILELVEVQKIAEIVPRP